MNCFPLFDSLIEEEKKVKISKEDKKLLEKVSELSEESQELIYAIIIKYTISKETELSYFPYNMQFENESPVIDTKKLPKQLRNILILFVKKTISSN